MARVGTLGRGPDCVGANAQGVSRGGREGGEERGGEKGGEGGGCVAFCCCPLLVLCAHSHLPARGGTPGLALPVVA